MANAVEQMEADGLTATVQDARCVARLYDAVERNDPAAAAACYAENARFEDVGFQLEGRAAIGRMWDLVWMAAGFRAEHDPAGSKRMPPRGRGVAATSCPFHGAVSGIIAVLPTGASSSPAT